MTPGTACKTRPLHTLNTDDDVLTANQTAYILRDGEASRDRLNAETIALRTSVARSGFAMGCRTRSRPNNPESQLRPSNGGGVPDKVDHRPQ